MTSATLAEPAQATGTSCDALSSALWLAIILRPPEMPMAGSAGTQQIELSFAVGALYPVGEAITWYCDR